MVDPDLDETVAVYLAAVDPASTRTDAPDAATVGEIGAALGVDGDRVAPRVALLSTLEDMLSRGLVARRTATDGGTTDGGPTYELSAAGRELAARTVDSVSNHEITVEHEDGTRTEVALSAVDEYVDDPALPRALARLSDEGVLYRRESVAERFVDRDEERTVLRAALDDAVDGSARTAIVCGAAGVGKTALLTDALAADARERGVEVLVGRCRPATTEPYAPVGEALGDRIAAGGDDPLDRADADPDRARAYAAERAAMFEAVTEALTAGEGPTALVIEDLHLAAEPTAALFDHLARNATGAVLVVGSIRTGVDDEAVPTPLSELVDTANRGGEDPQVARVDLSPFDRSATRSLIEVTVDHPTVPAAFVDAVYERTGGNALYVRETVAEMLDSGAVDPTHGVYPDDPAAVGPADAVESVIVDRLARLDDTTRRVLETGALLGGEVSLPLLSDTLDEREPRIRERASVLEAAGLWDHLEDRSSVRFRSDLLREVAAAELCDDRRRRLHRALAGAIEGRDDVDHGAAASHRLVAGDDERALSHLRAAGDRATAVYAHELALDHYESALEVARDRLGHDEDGDVVVDVLERIAEVYYLRGEYDEADKYYGYVDERVSDPETGRRIGRIRADMLDSIGRWEQALEVAEDAVESYGIADSHESGLLLGRRGAQLERRGNREDAEADFEAIEGIGERTGDEHLLAVADLNRGALDLRRQTVDETTIEGLERAVERAARSDDDRTHARSLNNLSRAHVQLQHFDEAEAVLERCLDVHETIGDRSALAHSKHNLADLYRRNGAFEDALELHAEAAETAETANNHVLLAGSREETAEIHRARGDLDDARRHLEAALDALDQLGHRRFVASRSAWLAGVALDRGDRDRARDLAREAVETAADTDAALARAATLAARGDVRLDAGQIDAAVEDYERGLERVVDEEDPAAGSTEVALAGGVADALARRGDHEEAESALDRARSALDPTEFPARVAPLGVVEARVARLGGDLEAASEAGQRALTDAREGGTRWRVAEVAALLELARIAAERGDEAAVAEHCRAASDLVGEHGIGRFEGVPGRIERGDGRNA